MLLSIFTPTHNPTFIWETYQSILRQQPVPWEWVIVPSAPDAADRLPETIKRDKRVVLVSGFEQEKNIGALKRAACDRAHGDVFIELDHDDLLVPGETLITIANKAAAGAGFIYSDAAVFKPNLSAHMWSEYFGWEHYPFKLYGRTFQAARCFEITPRVLSEIFQCPDHIRCWSRDAYFKAGGHDRQLSVCDDHDLMCRTYLTGSSFVHTGGCHYMYRLHGDNTIHERKSAIQINTVKVGDRYLAAMIREWCSRHDLPILDMASSFKRGWKWEADLSRGFGVNALGLLVCQSLHYCPPEEVTQFMNRAYDALVPGGYLEINFPTTNGRAAFLDHQARCFFNAETFLQYTRSTFARDPQRRCRYQLVRALDYYPNKFHEGHNLQYTTLTLMALKKGRYPGIKYI